jgi:transcriptional regulator with XRE-family HTH domain
MGSMSRHKIKALNNWLEENFTDKEIAELKAQSDSEAKAILRARELAAKFVADLMGEQNLGFNEFARRTGLSASHLSSILKGRSSPSLETLSKIVASFGKIIDISWH